MSVLDNVLVGAHSRIGFGGEAQAREDALATLDSLGLADLAPRPATGMPFATLKRIELARALAAKPRLLLLDEPAGGLNHEEISQLGDLIRRIQRDYELTIAAGTPKELQANPAVIEAYLGTGSSTQADAPAGTD